MAKNTEIELKLLVDKDKLKKLLELDCVAGAMRENSCQKRKLVSSYYDTTDLAFKRNGIAYRVRSKGDGSYEATVKTSVKNGAGLSERLELNLPLPNYRPKLEGFAELGLGHELTELAPQGVSKLFTVTVQRTTYILDLQGAVAELALDHGKITAGEATDAIDEVEIELLEGDKGALLQLAANIAAQVPIFVEKRSKFMRGLALRGISVDEAPLQDKLGSGSAKEEILAAIAAHGEKLFALKQHAENNDVQKLVKGARKELLALRSLASLAGVPRCNKLEYTLGLVENVRQFWELQDLWLWLRQKGGLDSRSLVRELGRAIAYFGSTLMLDILAGSFTAIVFDLTSQVYAADLAAETVETKVKTSLKEWQQVLDKKQDKAAYENDAEAAEVEGAQATPEALLPEKLIAAENICALARCCDLKAAIKASEITKKQRRQLRGQIRKLAWMEKLSHICQSSSSKNLYRDVGMILGYLLAKA